MRIDGTVMRGSCYSLILGIVGGDKYKYVTVLLKS